MRIMKGAEIRDNETLRKSFFELGHDVFGLTYDEWFNGGYWDDTYIPYCIVDDNCVIANVAVSTSSFVIDNEVVKAAQIGGVMTENDHRGQGFSRILMEEVLKDFASYDILFLFANDRVLNFYPKFGFEQIAQSTFTLNTEEVTFQPVEMKKIDLSDESARNFVVEMARNRMPVSTKFGVLGNESIVMFHALLAYSNCIYYVPALDAIVIGEEEGDMYHCYDVISKKFIPIEKMIEALPCASCKSIQFYFTPLSNQLQFHSAPLVDDGALFVKQQGKVPYPINVRFPATSIT